MNRLRTIKENWSTLNQSQKAVIICLFGAGLIYLFAIASEAFGEYSGWPHETILTAEQMTSKRGVYPPYTEISRSMLQILKELYGCKGPVRTITNHPREKGKYLLLIQCEEYERKPKGE